VTGAASEVSVGMGITCSVIRMGAETPTAVTTTVYVPV
jgi:hypothetical protein